MQRLSIARAMMHDPEVLFLDEPSAGLDPQTRLMLWEIIRDYNRAGQDHRAHHPLHGRGRRALRPPGDYRPRPHHRAGHAAGAEIVDSRRLPAAPALRQRAGEPDGGPALAAGSHRGALRRPCGGGRVRRSRRSADRRHRQRGAGGRRRHCATYTSPNRAWRPCFCITPEGAYAIELENIFRPAFARRRTWRAAICCPCCCRTSCSRCC